MTSEKLERGMLVESLAGHDGGQTFVITETVDGNYVLVANGKTRSVNNPKRKKMKHVKPIGKAIELDSLQSTGNFNDGTLSRLIKEKLK